MDTKKKIPKKKSPPYREGELNQLVDSLVHPHYRVHKGFLILDALAHAVVEQNPKKSLKKFLKYNSAELAEEIAKLISEEKK